METKTQKQLEKWMGILNLTDDSLNELLVNDKITEKEESIIYNLLKVKLLSFKGLFNKIIVDNCYGKVDSFYLINEYKKIENDFCNEFTNILINLDNLKYNSILKDISNKLDNDEIINKLDAIDIKNIE